MEFDPQKESIIGVDEAGRGSLAGPVYAAAVRIKCFKNISAYKDSKLLSPKAREKIFEEIITNQDYAIGKATAREIEELNILNAALLAMRRAVLDLGLSKKFLVLVDGSFLIPDLDLRQVALTKGESRAKSIAAASIVAKVARDKKMCSLSKEYPQYGFETHKGYPTQAHVQAVKRYGPCQIHRRTFSKIRELI